MRKETGLSFIHPFTYALTLTGISLIIGNFASVDRDGLLLDVHNKAAHNSKQFLIQENDLEKFEDSDDTLNEKKSQSKLPELIKEYEFGTPAYNKLVQYLGFFIASIVPLLVLFRYILILN